MADDMHQRLFFALWPSMELRAALASLRDELTVGHGSIKPVPTANLHLTLVFLGATDAATRVCYEQAVDRVTGVTSFSIQLDTVGHWQRGGIFWIGSRVVPPALSLLYDKLVSALGPCGFRPEARPLSAHVTLARNMRPPPLQCKAPLLVWRADEFCLVKSVTYPEGARYEILRCWRLPAA
jgi:RNA 2',3'-cyclic 3'-phosphodiesterase